jgi:hypothetical protein
MSTATIQARITEIEDIDLPGVRASIRALVTGNHSQYELDTGQSRQSLKRLSLKDLREYEKSLEEELQRLNDSLGSSGQIGRAWW